MTTGTERIVTLTRTFAVVPEQVYLAWLDGQLLYQWSAPNSCTMVSLRTDSRIGGTWESQFRITTGELHISVGEYLELVPGKRIVMSQTNVSDACPAQHVPTIVTVEFEPIPPSGTRMLFTQIGQFTDDDMIWMPVGWGSRVKLLEAMLEQSAAEHPDVVIQQPHMNVYLCRIGPRSIR